MRNILELYSTATVNSFGHCMIRSWLCLTHFLLVTIYPQLTHQSCWKRTVPQHWVISHTLAFTHFPTFFLDFNTERHRNTNKATLCFISSIDCSDLNLYYLSCQECFDLLKGNECSPNQSQASSLDPSAIKSLRPEDFQHIKSPSKHDWSFEVHGLEWHGRGRSPSASLRGGRMRELDSECLCSATW